MGSPGFDSISFQKYCNIHILGAFFKEYHIFPVHQGLSSGESVLALLDRLLVCETAFHNGESLLHSLMLCRILHDPQQLVSLSTKPHPIELRIAAVYSLSVLKCADVGYHAVGSVISQLP